MHSLIVAVREMVGNLVVEPARLSLRRGVVALLVVLAAFVANRAEALTACGTVITNTVSATMHSGPPEFVTYDVSYSATATVIVACSPALQMRKWVNWPTAGAGTTVTFTICIVNETQNSVWGVTVTDILPQGMLYRDDLDATPSMSDDWVSGNWYGSFQVPQDVSALPGIERAWRNTPMNPSMNAGPPGDGASGIYMRWTVDFVGPMRSACVTYAAEVL